MQNSWSINLAHEIQGYADGGNQKEFYSSLKMTYGPTYKAPSPVRSANGLRLVTYFDGITQRWAEHHRELLNTQRLSDPSI